MISQKTLTINKKPFVIQALPASKGFEAAIVLAHIVAGAANGIGSHKRDFFDTDFNIGRIVAGLFDRLDAEGTPAFIKDIVLLSVITPDLDGDSYEDEFAAEYETLVDLVTAILEHNKLFDVIKKKAAAVMGLLSKLPT
jgi:hypothetical protein